MRIYRNTDEVFSDRRKGVNLAEVIDSLLMTPDVWVRFGDSPFSIIEALYNDDYVDMSTPAWQTLSVAAQKHYAKAYQNWYADQKRVDILDFFTVPMVLIPPMKYRRSYYIEDGWTAPDLNEAVEKMVYVKSPFWMGEHEVTQLEFLLAYSQDYLFLEESLRDMPITASTWDDANKFCEKTGTKLPTEDQWELACRAGTTTMFNYGNNPDQMESHGWTSESGDYLRQVGKKQANAWGLYDMHGNVWEWVKDAWLNKMQSGKIRKSSNFKVVRGGSFSMPALRCHSACRGKLHQDTRWDTVGFRVIKDF